MKTSITGRTAIAGRVLIGPKKMRVGYARIVSCKDGSGVIESYDSAAGAWVAAAQTVTFDEVWAAPMVPPLIWARIGVK